MLAKWKSKNPVRKILVWCLKIFFKMIFIIILLTIVQVAVLRYLDPPFTVSMAFSSLRNGIPLNKLQEYQYGWRELKDISPFLIMAVLAGEDQRFMAHNGFDFREINQAVQDIIRDQRIRGASTITMQVARTLFLWPERSLLRKLLEAYYTMLLEIFLTKVRILELYLNMVDWGTGVIGAEAASQKYYKISATKLNHSQAARMAAILPNPHRWSPLMTSSKQFKARYERIMRDMGRMHL